MKRFAAMPAGRLLAPVLCMAFALLLGFAACPALAATRTIAGLEYSVPDDWEEAELDLSDLDALEGLDLDGLGMVDCALYSHEDGLLFVGFVPDPDVTGFAGADLDAGDFAEIAAELEDELAESGVSGLDVSVGVEGGCPVVGVSTDDIVFNDVAYRLSLKLVAVDNTVARGVVAMITFLPASGILTEDFASSLPVLAAPQRFSAGVVSYEVPEGYTVGHGEVLGNEFFLAIGDGGMAEVLNLAIPELLEEIGDLDMAEVVSALDGEIGDSGLWVGSYSFHGLPTLAIESMSGVVEDAYFGLTLNVSQSGLVVTMLMQPEGGDFVTDFLGTAEVDETSEPAAAPSRGSILIGFADEDEDAA